MNTKIISAIVIMAAMTAVAPVLIGSAYAQFFNTNNFIGDKTVTQTQTGTGGNGGNGGAGGLTIFGGDANGGNGGNGGDVKQSQGFCEQNAQSGAFGTSTNIDTGSVDNSIKSTGKDCS
jgi:hypothetical protein